jgi:hypothetical protein
VGPLSALTEVNRALMVEHDRALARNDRENFIGRVLGGNSGRFGRREENGWRRAIEVHAAGRAKGTLERPWKARGTLQFA